MWKAYWGAGFQLHVWMNVWRIRIPVLSLEDCNSQMCHFSPKQGKKYSSDIAALNLPLHDVWDLVPEGFVPIWNPYCNLNTGQTAVMRRGFFFPLVFKFSSLKKVETRSCSFPLASHDSFSPYTILALVVPCPSSDAEGPEQNCPICI